MLFNAARTRAARRRARIHHRALAQSGLACEETRSETRSATRGVPVLENRVFQRPQHAQDDPPAHGPPPRFDIKLVKQARWSTSAG